MDLAAIQRLLQSEPSNDNVDYDNSIPVAFDFNVPDNEEEEDRLRAKWRMNNYFAHFRRGDYYERGDPNAPWEQYAAFLERRRADPGPGALFSRAAAWQGRDEAAYFTTWDEIYDIEEQAPAESRRRRRMRDRHAGRGRTATLDAQFPQAERNRIAERLRAVAGLKLERFFNAGGNGAVALVSGGRADEARAKFVVKVGLSAGSVDSIETEKSVLAVGERGRDES